MHSMLNRPRLSRMQLLHLVKVHNKINIIDRHVNIFNSQHSSCIRPQGCPINAEIIRKMRKSVPLHDSPVSPDSPTPPGECNTNAPSGRPLPQETPRLQPRRSGRTRQPVTRFDNLYGSQNPTDVERMSNSEFENLFGDPRPSGQSQPGPFGSGPLIPPRDQHDHSLRSRSPPRAVTADRLVQDGGAGLINFLLSCAVDDGCTSLLSHQQSGKIPNVKNVREWHFKDLMRLPKAALEEWKNACKEELGMLHQRNVFKLTDLPKGRK